ncbi:MAG: hypothetical protein GQ574_27840 [Crocinitomix sp.]|nr:hypothetical protein [Crocinitomix sp.]
MIRLYQTGAFLLLFLISCSGSNKEKEDWEYMHKEDVVEFKFQYMMYACGECFNQHNLLEVIYSKYDYTDLLDKDFYVEFENKKEEEILDKETSKCKICYDYIYKGRVKTKKNGEYLFEVISGEALLRDDNCCE